MSLLLIELVRSLPKQYADAEVFLSCVPLALAVLAVPYGLTTVPTAAGMDIICYPPVTLALTGLALLWTGCQRFSSWSREQREYSRQPSG